MPLSDKLMNRIKKNEGLRLKPYTDTTGHLTIGYGRNLDDCGISAEEAEIMLFNDLTAARKQCFISYPDIFPDLSENRQDVLIEMMFNLGDKKLKTFQKMKIALERHDFELASKEMLNSRWAQQVGERAEELAKLMKEG